MSVVRQRLFEKQAMIRFSGLGHVVTCRVEVPAGLNRVQECIRSFCSLDSVPESSIPKTTCSQDMTNWFAEKFRYFISVHEVFVCTGEFDEPVWLSVQLERNYVVNGLLNLWKECISGELIVVSEEVVCAFYQEENTYEFHREKLRRNEE